MDTKTLELSEQDLPPIYAVVFRKDYSRPDERPSWTMVFPDRTGSRPFFRDYKSAQEFCDEFSARNDVCACVVNYEAARFQKYSGRGKDGETIPMNECVGQEDRFLREQKYEVGDTRSVIDATQDVRLPHREKKHGGVEEET